MLGVWASLWIDGWVLVIKSGGEYVICTEPPFSDADDGRVASWDLLGFRHVPGDDAQILPSFKV